jgi:hypothetical protein
VSYEDWKKLNPGKAYSDFQYEQWKAAGFPPRDQPLLTAGERFDEMRDTEPNVRRWR